MPSLNPLAWLPEDPGKRQDWLSTIYIFGSAILLAAFITLFIFQSYRVDGESMQNTLQNNDHLIIDKLPRTLARLTGHPYTPHRGDIIVFNEYGSFDGNVGNKKLIKRVVGLPGERIVIKDGQVTVYNTANPNGFDPDTSGLYRLDQTSTADTVDIILATNQVYVLGDNRGNSTDSRIFGPIEQNQIVGKLIVRFWPLHQAGRF